MSNSCEGDDFNPPTFNKAVPTITVIVLVLLFFVSMIIGNSKRNDELQVSAAIINEPKVHPAYDFASHMKQSRLIPLHEGGVASIITKPGNTFGIEYNGNAIEWTIDESMDAESFISVNFTVNNVTDLHTYSVLILNNDIVEGISDVLITLTPREDTTISVELPPYSYGQDLVEQNLTISDGTASFEIEVAEGQAFQIMHVPTVTSF